MLRYVVDSIRDALPLQLELDAAYAVRKARPWLSRLNLADYRLLHLAPAEGSTFNVLFWGRPQNAWRAWAGLGLPGDVATGPRPSLTDPATVFVSEIPFPHALQIPWEVHMVVPIRGDPLPQIEARMNANARRQIKRGRSDAHTKQVTDPADIDRINDTMLVPWALARHGTSARIMSRATVHRIATKTGRLDVLVCGGEEVGCHLGHALYAGAQHASGQRLRVWNTRLFGYPASVFTDPKRLPEVNGVNAWFALAWAHDHGYDAYDMGACLAKPEDGLLQWKRRRGGEPQLWRNDGCFYVRLPSARPATFLWETPLFAQEGDEVALHVGVPHGKSHKEIQHRLAALVIPGVTLVHLHADPLVSAPLVETVSAIHGDFEPVVDLDVAFGAPPPHLH